MPKVANGIDLDCDLAQQPRREPRARDQVQPRATTGRARCACSATRTTPTWAATARPSTPSRARPARMPDITASRRARAHASSASASTCSRSSAASRAPSRAAAGTTAHNETLRLHRSRRHVRDRRRPRGVAGGAPTTSSASRSSATASPTMHREYLRLGGAALRGFTRSATAAT